MLQSATNEPFPLFLTLSSLLIDKREDKVEETVPKRFTTTSSLKLKPGPDDDYTEYTCQAKHKALSPDMPMRATVQLSVLCE